MYKPNLVNSKVLYLNYFQKKEFEVVFFFPFYFSKLCFPQWCTLHLVYYVLSDTHRQLCVSMPCPGCGTVVNCFVTPFPVVLC